MIKKLILTLSITLAATHILAAKVDKNITIKVGGENRSYILYVPDNVQANAPLVFSLHGTSGSSSNKAPFRTSVADEKGCIVVYPQGKSLYFPVFGGNATGWHSIGETSEDIDFFKAIIEDVNSQYTIDRKRIYCCGFSNGGMMTYTVANVCSYIFAAFASISGFPLNEFHLHTTSARPFPFLHIHGKADDFVKYSLMPSIVDNIVARNGAIPVPQVSSKSGKYKKSVYKASEGSFPYIYYEIDGMGHNDYTANTEDGNSALTMWNFFSQYTLDSPRDETLRWRPYVDYEGWAPKSHGWSVNATTTLLLFGKDQKTNANQNVYRALQFETGKYKLCFNSEGEQGKTITVKLQKLTSPKTVVLEQTVPVGQSTTLYFDVNDGWGEYKFTMTRESYTDQITIHDLAIYTATGEEAQTSITTPSVLSTPSSIHSYSLTSHIVIEQKNDGTYRKRLITNSN